MGFVSVGAPCGMHEGDVRVVRRLPRRVVGGVDVQREDDRGRRGAVAFRETNAETDSKGDEEDDGGDDSREPGPEPRGALLQPTMSTTTTTTAAATIGQQLFQIHSVHPHSGMRRDEGGMEGRGETKMTVPNLV